MPQTRSIISHGISSASNVIIGHVVAMMPLMEAREAEQVGGSRPRSDRAAPRPADGRRVVTEE